MSFSFNTGVPSKLIKEFLNRKITVDSSSGDVYKGILLELEDNMNMTLGEVKATLVDGKAAKMASVYIKGCRIRLIILPESAIDSVSKLARQSSRGGRGGFRGVRGGRSGRGGGGFRSDGGSRSSYDCRRY